LNKDTDTSGTPRILITGGAGFIGYRAAEFILSSSTKTNVAIYDNLSVGMPMPKSSERLKTFHADILDKSKLREAISSFRPQTIIHLAALHHIPTCERERARALDINITGTENVLEMAEIFGVSRIVLASSGAVYDWQDGPLDEAATPLFPRDNYALAKYSNERQLAFWAARTGATGIIARIFNTIGHDDPNGHLIPDIIEQIPIGQKSATISLGNLSPRRDYIHADDTARAIAKLASASDITSIEIFNIASGKDYSVAELVAMLGDVMGVAITVEENAARKRRVDRPSQLGAIKKIESKIGFKSQKSLRIALEDIVRNSKWKNA
jgi:UDP-glucose 4-epimerase